MKYKNAWFTLVEVLMGILIFSIVILWWFQALSAVTMWKIKLIEKADMSKEMLYLSEKLFDSIKSWWTIDYEEYFNRKVVWIQTQSWHYTIPTWFWNFWYWWNVWGTNFWNGFYYCRSWNWVSMWTWWCYNDTTFNDLAQSWSYQRYWEYSLQFIDYNSNINLDLWDENWDWKIVWDDDDENLWEWPIVFSWWSNVREIYLISKNRKKRTLFRWTWRKDEFAPPSENCNSMVYSTWCLWTIEFLVLDWKDRGQNHTLLSTSTWSFDWVIDTWVVSPDFVSTTDDIVAWTNTWTELSSFQWWYWQPLFPDNISVKNFEVYMYPNIDRNYAWKDNSPSTNINPYVRIKMTLTPSWKKRKAIKWNPPEININTTINLSDYFSN